MNLAVDLGHTLYNELFPSAISVFVLRFLPAEIYEIGRRPSLSIVQQICRQELCLSLLYSFYW